MGDSIVFFTRAFLNNKSWQDRSITVKLRQLERQDIFPLNDKPVYILNYSEYYLGEFCDEYGILESICIGFDNREHVQGIHSFRGHKITVKGFEEGLPNGVLVILAGYPQEYFNLLKNIPNSESIDVIFFYCDMEMKFDLYYRKKFKTEPLQNIIIFRSGSGASQYIPGEDFNENCRALFQYMLSIGLDRIYKLVWLVKDPDEYNALYKKSNVLFLSYYDAISDVDEVRELYYKNICLAKYIFASHTMLFARNARADQIRVMLWHGCGFKRTVRLQREEKRYEYMTVTSDMYAKLHADAFGLKMSQMLITGLPKEDWLFKPIKDFFCRFHIPKTNKYVFWLPTWRTTAVTYNERTSRIVNATTGLPIFKNENELIRLDNKLKKMGITLIIKPHPWQNEISHIKGSISNIIVIEHRMLNKERVFINELLNYADALISDYSSVAVDYMLLDRPMAFTVDDCSEYGKEWGFYWDNIEDYLPGKLIYNEIDFEEFLEEVNIGKDRSLVKRCKLFDEFHRYKDEYNSKRIVETLGVLEGK